MLSTPLSTAPGSSSRSTGTALRGRDGSDDQQNQTRIKELLGVLGANQYRKYQGVAAKETGYTSHVRSATEGKNRKCGDHDVARPAKRARLDPEAKGVFHPFSTQFPCALTRWMVHSKKCHLGPTASASNVEWNALGERITQTTAPRLARGHPLGPAHLSNEDLPSFRPQTPLSLHLALVWLRSRQKASILLRQKCFLDSCLCSY